MYKHGVEIVKCRLSRVQCQFVAINPEHAKRGHVLNIMALAQLPIGGLIADEVAMQGDILEQSLF